MDSTIARDEINTLVRSTFIRLEIRLYEAVAGGQYIGLPAAPGRDVQVVPNKSTGGGTLQKTALAVGTRVEDDPGLDGAGVAAVIAIAAGMAALLLGRAFQFMLTIASR